MNISGGLMNLQNQVETRICVALEKNISIKFAQKSNWGPNPIVAIFLLTKPNLH